MAKAEARRSLLVDNAFYLMANSLATSFLGFVFWNLMTRFYLPAEVGIGAALIAGTGLVALLGNLSMGAALVRFVPEAGPGAKRLVNAVLTLAAVFLPAWALVYLVWLTCSGSPLAFIAARPVLAVAFILCAMVTGLSVLVDQALVAGLKARFVLIKNVVLNILRLPLPLLFFAGQGGVGILAGTGLALAGGLLMGCFLMLPRVYPGYLPRPVWDMASFRMILPYAMGNYAAGLFNGLPGYVYPLMILSLLGAESSAFFYVAWMMSAVLGLIPAGFAQSLFAEASHRPETLAGDARKALLLAVVLALLAVGALEITAGWLLGLFGEGYAAQSATLRCLVLGVLPMCLNALFLVYNQVQKRITPMIAQTGLISALGLGLGYWFAIRWGLPGIGMAYACSQAVVAGLVAVPLWRGIRPRAIQRRKPGEGTCGDASGGAGGADRHVRS